MFGHSNDFTSVRMTDCSGLQHILELHSHQLNELSVQVSQSITTIQNFAPPPTRAEWYEQGFLKVSLPKLKILELRMDLFTDLHLTCTYLRRFENSLTSLALLRRTFSYTDIATLCRVFSRRNNLRALTVTVDILSPQLLELFATELSNLETLHLPFNELSSRPSDRVPHGAIQFKEALWTYNKALAAHRCTGWKLQHLTAHARYVSLTVSELEECEKALRITLPDVILLKLE